MGPDDVGIPLLERLVLSNDRRVTAKEIFVPGTKERVFFDVLYALHQKDFNTARSLLAAADHPWFGKEREQLEAFMLLKAWDDSAASDSHTALQQLLIKKLREVGYNFEAHPNFVPTAPTDPDDFEQVGDAVFPCAVTEDEYGLDALVKKLKASVVTQSMSLPEAYLVFPHVSHEMQRAILQAQKGVRGSVFMAALPGVEGVLMKWMDESVEEAGEWLQKQTAWLTVEQLQTLLTSAAAVQRDARLQRLIQSALVMKLYPSDSWEEVKQEPERVAALLDQIEQLCAEMGQQADWIRLQVSASRLQLLYKHGRPLPMDMFVQFLEAASKVAWMAPPVISVTAAGQEVHHGITCDRCHMAPLIGVRYKSKSHDDYDVCGGCFPHSADTGPFTVISGSTYHTHIFLDFTHSLGPAVDMPRSASGMLLTVTAWLKDVVLNDGTGIFNQPQTPLSAVISPEVYNKTVAEALLLSGKAQNEEYWIRMYEAAHGDVQRLVERQELTFLQSNKEVYGVAEAVTLQLAVKNIPSVLIKVYEINSWNYYINENRELDPSLQLVGISPTVEKTFTFNNPAIRREVLSWQLLEARRGVFVVDVMGAGMTRRAIIRKGQLRYTEHRGVAGHELKVFYEDWSVVKGAKVRLDERTVEADENGDIIIPYAMTNAKKTLVVGDAAGAASLYGSFDHRSENAYVLHTNMYLERECVHPHEDVPLVIRTSLYLDGTESVPLSLVEDVALRVWTKTQGGIRSMQVIKGFQLSQSPQVVPIPVQEACYGFDVQLTGRIKLVAPGENGETRYQDLAEEKSFPVDTTKNVGEDHIWDTYLLGQPDGTWGLQVLGRAGEIPRDPVRMQVILVPDFEAIMDSYTFSFEFQVQTGATGLVKLGSLANIKWVKVVRPGTVRMQPQYSGRAAPRTSISQKRTWHVSATSTPRAYSITTCQYSWNIPVPVGGVTASITIPRTHPHPAISKVFLWRVKCDGHGTGLSGVVSDVTQQFVQVLDGVMLVHGLPAGRYLLMDVYSAEKCLLSVVETVIPVNHPAWEHGIVPAKYSSVPWTPPKKLSVMSYVASATDGVSVRVQGSAGRNLKAMLVFRRFMPFPEELDYLKLGLSAADCNEVQGRKASQFLPPTGAYMEGTHMLPALQYVLLRRELSALPHPGNMLDRPSLLSAPHKVGTTTTINRQLPTDIAAAAFMFQDAPAPPVQDSSTRTVTKFIPEGRPPSKPMYYCASPMLPERMTNHGVPKLDFCPAALVLGPLEVGADGQLMLSPEQLRERGLDLGTSGHTMAFVAVVSDDGEAALGMSTIKGALGSIAAPVRDMGIGHARDPGLQCVPVWDISPLTRGAVLNIPDMSSTKLAVYDDMTMARDLLLAMPGAHITDGQLLRDTFSFLTDWPRLTVPQKLTHLKERWCNELSFFLYHRDREVFNEAILPSIQAKMKSERCFLDWWFLEDPETVSFWSRTNKYTQLNAVERILLAERAGASSLQQLVHDWKQKLVPGRDPSAIAWRQQERKKKMIETALAVVMSSNDSSPSYSPTSPDYQPTSSFAGPMQAGAASLPGAASGYTPQSFSFSTQALRPMMKSAQQAMTIRGEQLQQRQVLFKEKVVINVWAETSYYNIKPVQEDNKSMADLVPADEFWLDYAEWLASRQQGPFLTSNLGYAAHSFTSAVMGLAVIGLPFEGSPQKAYHTSLQGPTTVLHADGPIIAFHKQQKPAPSPLQRSQTMLVSQVLIDPQDPKEEDPVTKESFQKVVTPPLKVGHEYIYSVVVTNMSPSGQLVDVVIQAPQGAIPLKQAEAHTEFSKRGLLPFSGHQFFHSFYFPHPGTFSQYPCSVLRDGKLIWNPESPLPALSVLASVPTPPPSASIEEEFDWAKFVATASNEEVLKYLAEGNLDKASLPDIAGRCHDKHFFVQATERLHKRHTFCMTIWQFAVKHMDKQGLKELLQAMDSPWMHMTLGDLIMDTELLKVEPRDLKYRHLEYWPVVHRLAHPMPAAFGQPSQQSVCQLLEDSDSIKQQFQTFLYMMACKPKLSPLDVLEYAQYLILQDRLDAAEQLLTSFFTPDAMAELGSECAMQVDYMRAWLNISSLSSDLSVAQTVATKYKALEASLHPIWAERFGELYAMLEEVAAAAAGTAYIHRPASKMAQIQEPMLLLKGPIDAQGILAVATRNISQLQVHAYVIDVELIFTAQPFGQLTSGSAGAATGQLGHVSYVKPTCSWTIPVQAAAGVGAPGGAAQADAESATNERVVPLQVGALLAGAGLGSTSVMLELNGGGLTRSTVRFASKIHVELLEKQGILQAVDATTLLPLSAAYVKVFARGSTSDKNWLFKDGYTDRRGKFNYATITAGADDDKPTAFALLVASSSHGSVILEASAPA